MNLDEIIGALGGPTKVPSQPEGGSDVQPLTGHHLARPGAEAAPANVEPQQGAGSAGALTPGGRGTASDGTVEAGTDDHYSALGGPDLLSPSSGLGDLTPDPSHGRPSGGDVPIAEQSGAATDPRLGSDQTGQQPGHPLFVVKKSEL